MNGLDTIEKTGLGKRLAGGKERKTTHSNKSVKREGETSCGGMGGGN